MYLPSRSASGLVLALTRLQKILKNSTIVRKLSEKEGPLSHFARLGVRQGDVDEAANGISSRQMGSGLAIMLFIIANKS
jgi:hypothetical protein